MGGVGEEPSAGASAPRFSFGGTTKCEGTRTSRRAIDARTSSLSLPLVFPFSSESSCSGGGFFLSSANVTASTLSSSMARICRLSACAEGPCPEGSFFRGIMAPHATLSGVT